MTTHIIKLTVQDNWPSSGTWGTSTCPWVGIWVEGVSSLGGKRGCSYGTAAGSLLLCTRYSGHHAPAPPAAQNKSHFTALLSPSSSGSPVSQEQKVPVGTDSLDLDSFRWEKPWTMSQLLRPDQAESVSLHPNVWWERYLHHFMHCAADTR